MTEQIDTNLFDRIRTTAAEKRAARLKEKEKNDEFFARLKNGAANNSLKENQKKMGENR